MLSTLLVITETDLHIFGENSNISVKPVPITLGMPLLWNNRFILTIHKNSSDKTIAVRRFTIDDWRTLRPDIRLNNEIRNLPNPLKFSLPILVDANFPNIIIEIPHFPHNKNISLSIHFANSHRLMSNLIEL